MRVRIFFATAVTAALALSAGAASAQLIRGNPAIQDGRFFLEDSDPERTADSVAQLLAAGPLVVASGGVRSITTDICLDLIWVAQGADKVKRKADAIKLKQKSNLMIFFEFFQCIDEELFCRISASDPFPVEECSVKIEADTDAQGIAGIANSETRAEAKLKLKCDDGIDPSAVNLELSEDEQAWVLMAFPGIAEKFVLKFEDDSSLRQDIDDSDVDDLDELLEDMVEGVFDNPLLPPCPP